MDSEVGESMYGWWDTWFCVLTDGRTESADGRAGGRDDDRIGERRDDRMGLRTYGRAGQKSGGDDGMTNGRAGIRLDTNGPMHGLASGRTDGRLD